MILIELYLQNLMRNNIMHEFLFYFKQWQYKGCETWNNLFIVTTMIKFCLYMYIYIYWTGNKTNCSWFRIMANCRHCDQRHTELVSRGSNLSHQQVRNFMLVVTDRGLYISYGYQLSLPAPSPQKFPRHWQSVASSVCAFSSEYRPSAWRADD
jgi:hypothetical protein